MMVWLLANMHRFTKLNVTKNLLTFISKQLQIVKTRLDHQLNSTEFEVRWLDGCVGGPLRANLAFDFSIGQAQNGN